MTDQDIDLTDADRKQLARLAVWNERMKLFMGAITIALALILITAFIYGLLFS